MLSEMEIWRSAAAMIKSYGADAGLESAKRADDLLAAGDTEGAATWRRTITVLEKIQAVQPGQDGEAALAMATVRAYQFRRGGVDPSPHWIASNSAW